MRRARIQSYIFLCGLGLIHEHGVDDGVGGRNGRADS